MAELIIAACDGASKGNPGPSAWAWVIADEAGRPERWEAGPLGTATNNIAELTALQSLLESVDPDVPLEVRMDSQYAMKAVSTWLPGWKRNGWKTSAGKPVANQDIVMRIDALLTDRTVDFVYVAAHQVDGDVLNAFADRAASQAAFTQQAAGTAAGSPVPEAAAGDTPPRGSQRDRRPGSPQKGQRKTSTGAIEAKFAGRCRCGKPYEKGEQITKNPSGWGHPACRTS